MRIPFRTSPMVLVLAFLLPFAGCDGGATTSGDSDSTVVHPPTSNSRVVVVVDTIQTTQTTVTYVKRKLLISDFDTSVLSVGDTVRVIAGATVLDTGVSKLDPCPDGLTIYNAYGTEVTMELWTGYGLEYRAGRVYGDGLASTSTTSLLPDSLHNRWCTGWKGLPANSTRGMLLVVGVPIDPGGPSYFLVQGQFPETDAKSILVVDELGRLRTLR